MRCTLACAPPAPLPLPSSPGTGKTSLCRALAHKLSIALGGRFPSSQLIEINAHSLFSKCAGAGGGGCFLFRRSTAPSSPLSLARRWFSESGKLVTRLFEHISELADDGGIAGGCTWAAARQSCCATHLVPLTVASCLPLLTRALPPLPAGGRGRVAHGRALRRCLWIRALGRQCVAVVPSDAPLPLSPRLALPPLRSPRCERSSDGYRRPACPQVSRRSGAAPSLLKPCYAAHHQPGTCSSSRRPTSRAPSTSPSSTAQMSSSSSARRPRARATTFSRPSSLS